MTNNPDFDQIKDNLFKKLNVEIKKKSVDKIKCSKLKDVQYCANKFLKYNESSRDNYIKLEKSFRYSIVWDVNLAEKSYKAFPGYIIKKNKKSKNWKVIKYI